MTPQIRADVDALNAVADQAKARRVVKRARFRRVNARRPDLIVARVGDDDPELVALQAAAGRVVELAHPCPDSDPALAEALCNLDRRAM